MPARRFPPPWSFEDVGAEVQHRAFVIKDKNGQALAYVYFEDEPARRSAAKLLSKEGAADCGGYRKSARNPSLPVPV